MDYNTKLRIAILASVGIMAVGSVKAHASIPAVIVGSADMVSPPDALAYYGSPASPPPQAERDPVVQEMARSLRYDIDLIYEYVRDNVEFTPLFGLQKGARGVFFDQTGTAFDQANVMVEALREADAVAGKGYDPKYRVGQIALTGEQFSSWFGVSDPEAARRILADGGIPATVVGSGGTITSVAMLHIWVEATIGETAYVFDPALKGHTFAPPANLAVAMGYNRTALVNAGATGATYDAVSVLAFNQAAFRAKLDEFRGTLETWLAANARGAVADAAVGGKDITPHAASERRRTTLPYVTTSDRLWTGNIPAIFRSSLTVSLNGNTYGTYYADEFYGKLLSFGYENSSSGANTYGQLTAVSGRPGLCDLQRNTSTTPQAVAGIAINHPYASSGGTYMDRTLTKPIAFRVCSGTPSFFYVTADWGVSTGGVRAKLAPISGYLSSSQAFGEVILSTTLAAIPAQYSRYLELAGNQLDFSFLIHDMVGLHHIDGVANENKTFGSGFEYTTIAPAQMLTADYEAGISVNAIGAVDDARRRAGAQLAISGLALVESGTMRQESDAVRDVTSLTLFTGQNSLSSNPGNYRHYLTNSTNWTSVRNSSLQQYPSELKQILDGYIANGFSLFLPQRGDLRQGVFTVALTSTAQRQVNLLEATSPSADVVERPTFFAFRPSGSNQIDAGAFLIYDPRRGRPLKGGITVQLLDNADNALKEPTAPKVAEASAVFSTFAVDPQHGTFTYSPPADLTDGSGSFPHALTLQRQYRQGDYADQGMGRGWRHNWWHTASLSNDGEAALGASSAQAMAAAIVGIQASFDLLSVAPSPLLLLASAHAQKWTADQTINNVAIIDSELDTPVTFFRQGDGSFVPAKLGDGVLVQSGQPSDSLINRRIYQDVEFAYTDRDGGVRNYAFANKPPMPNLGEPVFLAELARKTLHMKQWAMPDGFRIFTDYTQNNITDQIYLYRAENSFGRAIQNTLYDVGDRGNRPICHGPNSYPTFTAARRGEVRFTASTGGEVILQRTAAPKFTLIALDPESARCNSQGSIATRLRVFGSDMISATDLSQQVWRYTTGAIPTLYDPALPTQWGPLTAVTKIFLPSQTSTPAATLSFGADGRTRGITDALNRTYQYRAMPSRGDEETPLGAISTSRFDRFDRKTSTSDPLGRTTSYQYDVRGLMTKTISPELNAEEYTYDIRGNRTSVRIKPKPGPALADIVTSTTYVEGEAVVNCANWKICNKPLYEIDGRTNRTDYDWNTATGSLVSVTGPADSAGVRPVTGYGYQAFTGVGGAPFLLPTSRTQKVDANASLITGFGYDTGNKFVLNEVVVDAGGAALRTCLKSDVLGQIISKTEPKAGLATCP